MTTKQESAIYLTAIASAVIGFVAGYLISKPRPVCAPQSPTPSPIPTTPPPSAPPSTQLPQQSPSTPPSTAPPSSSSCCFQLGNVKIMVG